MTQADDWKEKDMMACPMCGTTLHVPESLLREREGMVHGGWRYRNKRTGRVIFSESCPDAMDQQELADYEVTELFARNPLSAHDERKE